MWRVTGRSECLAIAGGSMEDVNLAKAAWIWTTVYPGKTKMKGKVHTGQAKDSAVKTDFETKAKMKGKVGAGRSKHNVVKTDLETKATMKAAKTDSETEITATGTHKVEIKETAMRAAKNFKNQATKNEVRPQKGDNGKDQQKGGNTRQQHMKGCLKDPKRPSKGQKKTVRFNLPEDDFGSRCKRQTGELYKNKRGRGAKGEQWTRKHCGGSRMPLLTVLSIR